VVCECSVAAGRTLEVSLPVELHFPESSARGINDKHVSLMVERNAVGNERLGAQSVGGVTSRWRHGNCARWQGTHVTSHTPHSAGVEIHLICHWLDAKYLHTIDRRRSTA